MSWSVAQYTKFEDERTRPVRDLLARIPQQTAAEVADLGCGPGNSTELLQARFPGARLTAMDSSAEMIEAARRRLPGIHCEIDDIAKWRNPGPFDVILANASLQWIPDHEALLPALLAKLEQGGSLAVQIPDNLDEPAHCLMREVAAGGEWNGKLAAASRARAERYGVEWYYQTLRSHGAIADIWRTTYHHPLAGGAAAVVEWFKGTGLRPFLEPLDASEREAFLARYRALIDDAYPGSVDGTVMLPFPRLFFVATI